MSSEAFFAALKRLGIRKSDKPHGNIEESFKVHRSLKGQIAIDKVQKCIDGVLKSGSLQKLGTMVRKS